LRDPRPLQWAPRNLVGTWQDNKRRPLEEEAMPEIHAALTLALRMLKNERSEDGASRKAMLKQAIRESASRQDALRKHDRFLEDKTARHARYLRYAAFADHLAEAEANLPDDVRLKRLRHAVLMKAEALKRSIDTETRRLR